MCQLVPFFEAESAVDSEVTLTSEDVDFTLLLRSGTRNMSRSSSRFVAETVRFTFFFSAPLFELSPHIEAVINRSHQATWLIDLMTSYQALVLPSPLSLPPSSDSPGFGYRQPFLAGLWR